MPPRNLLPRLDQGNIGAATVGSWIVLNSPGELTRLQVGRPDQEVRTRIQSIPSPWARMLLFRLALKDPSHPARRLVENELLDALQFVWSASERPNAPLKYDHIRFTDLFESADRLGSQRAEWWARAISELLPGQSGAGRSMESLTVLSVGDRPILASSPFTILFSAEDAATSPRDLTGPFFRYATGDEGRELAERPFPFQRYVAQVLLPQLENSENLVHVNSDVNALQTETKRWLQDQVQKCRRAAGSAHLAQLEAPSDDNWRAAADTLGLEEVADLTGGVRLFMRKSGADMRDSEWILRSTRQISIPPLVLQPKMFNGRFYPGSAVVNLPADLEAWDRDTLPQTGTRYPWVYPEKHWFAEQILILAEPVERANVFGFANFRSLYSGEKDYLKTPQFTLPLKREILEFFTPEELERRLSIDVQPSGHVEVSLRIPVGPDQRELTIKRRYDDSAFFHEVTGPALTLWPKFHTEHWKDYTLFRRDENPNVAQFISLHAVVAGEVLSEDAEQRNDVARVSSFERAPEGIEFVSLITGGASPQRLGMVLPKYGRAQPVGPIHWRIGIDFGTSNTVVSVKQGVDQPPIMLQASDMTLPLTSSTPETLSMLDAYFMPHTLAPRPFGTAAVVFDKLRNFNIHGERIGVRVNVPFSGHVQADKNNRVAGDLKWSTEADIRFVTMSFLRHVVAVILAQATERGIDPRHVDFVWSYPRAFSQVQITQLEDVWKQVRVYFAERLGGIGTVAKGLDESRAVLQFFANDQQITTAGDVNVIVDIGGGTSDIAMYGHGKTLVLDSVMLGGRNLTGQREWAGTAVSQRNAFVRRFVSWADRSSLTDYPMERNAVMKYLDDGQDHLAFTYLLQSKWFRDHGAPFSGDESAHRFQTLVLYLLGSLAYYVGLSLRELGDRDPDRDYTPVAVMLAGNGSQYMYWLTNLSRNDISKFGSVLGRLILAGMGERAGTTPPRVSLTPNPKEEVALGLVARAEIQVGGSIVDGQSSLAGEAYSAKLGDQRRERTFKPAERLHERDILFADQIAELQWSADDMEIERFHAAFTRELDTLVGYGAHWGANAQSIRAVLDELPRRELQQLTRARLQLIASATAGFHGSMYIVETAAVAARIQDRFFSSGDTATGASTQARAGR
jgi:hypothetical protein